MRTASHRVTQVPVNNERDVVQLNLLIDDRDVVRKPQGLPNLRDSFVDLPFHLLLLPRLASFLFTNSSYAIEFVRQGSCKSSELHQLLPVAFAEMTIYVTLTKIQRPCCVSIRVYRSIFIITPTTASPNRPHYLHSSKER